MTVIKNFLKITVSLIALLLLPVGSWAACTGSSPTWTSTPDYASVNSCVSQASAGDTINVSAGSATWTSRLLITKGINLIGAGIGNTTITANVSSCIWMIKYDDSVSDEYLRISGFTFDLNNKGAIFLEVELEPTTALIRVDHNRFTNSSAAGSCVFFKGAFGVIDNNVIDDVKYPFRTDGRGQPTWLAYDSDDFWGTGLNMYIEDNVIDFGNQETDWPVTDCDYGSRWAIRYNTIIMQGYHWSLTDMHGGRGSHEGGMGAELYGNYIDTNGYEAHIIHDRGARVTTHHNNAAEASSVFIKLSTNNCPGSEPIERQNMNNTYHFQNRKSTTGALIADYIARDDCGILDENKRYWMDNTDCIGGCSSISSGVGCGSTLPSQCTPSSDTSLGSTAFWLTDQSCTDLTGLTGASTNVTGGNRNPSSIIEGTLYICTATDTWTPWYTPYTYPHPLRVDTTPSPPSPSPPSPSPPSNLRIVEER